MCEQPLYAHFAQILHFPIDTWVPTTLDLSGLLNVTPMYAFKRGEQMDTWILAFFEWCKNIIICLWRSEQRHCHHRNGQYRGERQKEKKKVPTEERESLRTNISRNILGVIWFKVV